MSNRVIWVCLQTGEYHPLWIEPGSEADQVFDNHGHLPVAPGFANSPDALPMLGSLAACDMRLEPIRPGRRFALWNGTPAELTADDWARIGHRFLSDMPSTRVRNFDEPGCEGADAYDWGEEHFALPWAMVGRVSGQTLCTDGEPIGGHGEARVVLANYPAHSVPEAFSDHELPIGLHLLHPWGPLADSKKADPVGAIRLSPEHARALAAALLEAARREEKRHRLAVAQAEPESKPR